MELDFEALTTLEPSVIFTAVYILTVIVLGGSIFRYHRKVTQLSRKNNVLTDRLVREATIEDLDRDIKEKKGEIIQLGADKTSLVEQYEAEAKHKARCEEAALFSSIRDATGKLHELSIEIQLKEQEVGKLDASWDRLAHSLSDSIVRRTMREELAPLLRAINLEGKIDGLCEATKAEADRVIEHQERSAASLTRQIADRPEPITYHTTNHYTSYVDNSDHRSIDNSDHRDIDAPDQRKLTFLQSHQGAFSSASLQPLNDVLRQISDGASAASEEEARPMARRLALGGA